MTELKEATVAIIGWGLMGGSLGLALRARASCRRILAITGDAQTQMQLLADGVADVADADMTCASEADVIVLATPVRTILEHLPQIGDIAHAGAVVLDLGSTKQEVVAAMEQLPPHLEPIGGHPMCGKEASGFQAADAALFQDAVFVLSPLPRTSAQALGLVESLVRAIGAHPLLLDPERHDQAVAAISHLPYVLAAALMVTAREQAKRDSMVWQLAASGFRDTSRLAASDTPMMMDILLTNRLPIVELTRCCARQLDQMADWIEQGEARGLEALLEDAARRRRNLYMEMDT